MPTFNTSFCRLLHLDLPIVQAPIGNATAPALVAAVSNAGGLGMLSVTWRSPDAIRKMQAPHRVLRNSKVIEWEASGFPQSGHRPGEGEAIATAPGGRSMLRYGYALPQPGMEGDVEALALYAGQSVGLVSDVQSAGALVKALADETVQALKQSGSLLC